ncbi:MAG: ATP-binding cassette domain-containing protein [Rudanella sp.]|nr:ATP-binding cassette domain-containing protein [Rudanella sp.]
MIQIMASDVGKKYRREWVFRHLDLTLTSRPTPTNTANSYTFVGPNGSGKSTLLQLLSGALPVTEGMLTYTLDNKTIASDEWFRQVVIAAPYLELIEELTLSEMLAFHVQFKPFKATLSNAEAADRMRLSHAMDKELKFFSSGMKQRVKLGLAFFSDVPLVILDEPTSNLDRQGAAWYHDQVRLLQPDQLLLIGSNDPAEYDFCPNVLDVMQWKK